jgi:hypothetical protein
LIYVIIIWDNHYQPRTHQTSSVMPDFCCHSLNTFKKNICFSSLIFFEHIFVFIWALTKSLVFVLKMIFIFILVLRYASEWVIRINFLFILDFLYTFDFFALLFAVVSRVKVYKTQIEVHTPSRFFLLFIVFIASRTLML